MEDRSSDGSLQNTDIEMKDMDKTNKRNKKTSKKKKSNRKISKKKSLQKELITNIIQDQEMQWSL